MATLAKYARANLTTNVLTSAYAVVLSGSKLNNRVIDSIYINERSGAGTATTFNLQINAGGAYSFVRYNQLFTNTVAYIDQAFGLQDGDKLEIKSTANVDVVVGYREFKVNLPDV